MNRLLSPNLWIAIFCVLAVIGIVLAIVGTTADMPWVKTTGIVLILPIVIGGILLVLIGFPVLIIANRKLARTIEDDYDGQNDHAKNE